MNATTIGLRIGKYLKDQGVKQTFISQKTGLSAGAVSAICRGKRNVIDAVDYYKICNALQVGLDTFLEE